MSTRPAIAIRLGRTWDECAVLVNGQNIISELRGITVQVRHGSGTAMWHYTMVEKLQSRVSDVQ